MLAFFMDKKKGYNWLNQSIICKGYIFYQATRNVCTMHNLLNETAAGLKLHLATFFEKWLN